MGRNKDFSAKIFLLVFFDNVARFYFGPLYVGKIKGKIIQYVKDRDEGVGMRKWGISIFMAILIESEEV